MIKLNIMKTRTITLYILLISLQISCVAKKDCNLATSGTDGKTVQTLTLQSKTGDITLGKSGNDYYIGYMTKGFYNIVRGGMAKYQIDRVEIKFSDSSIGKYKAEGAGIAPEMVVQPKFWGTYFSIKLTKSEWDILKFKRIISFSTFGEKESKGEDKISVSSGKKIKQALLCFK
jgi:hypothetical protein